MVTLPLWRSDQNRRNKTPRNSPPEVVFFIYIFLFSLHFSLISVFISDIILNVTALNNLKARSVLQYTVTDRYIGLCDSTRNGSPKLPSKFISIAGLVWCLFYALYELFMKWSCSRRFRFMLRYFNVHRKNVAEEFRAET